MTRWAPRAVAAALILIAVAGVVAARLWPDQMWDAARQAAGAGQHMGIAGWLLAGVVQVVIALCGIVPASIGAFAMGMAFGYAGGFAVSAVATVVGAMLAFALTRSLFRPMIERRLSRSARLRGLDAAVARDGWRLVVLLRVSPIMPFAATSYALGLTGLSLRGYSLGTLAALPATFGFVAMGHLASAGVASFEIGETGLSSNLSHWALVALTIGATGLLTLRLSRIVRLVVRLPDAPEAEPAP